MALPSSLHRFTIDLSDVDRGVYEQLEFRLVKHPSESTEYALVRVIAYAMEYAEFLEFGPGLCESEVPALSTMNEHGGIGVWLDIGGPSADRLHKATKAADQVIIYTHRDLEPLYKEWSSRSIHQAESIRVVHVPRPLLRDLSPTLDRNNAWTLLRTEGVLYVTVNDETYTGELTEAGVLAPE